MSQYLTLVRHAKSSWKDQGQSDYDRPLNQRGRRDSLVMAERMLSRNCIPDLMLVSSARRAQETSTYLQQAFQLTPEQYQLVDDLYLAEPETLLDVMASTPESVRHLMIIAHNPGLETLCEMLAGHSLQPLPTLGIRHFACPSIRSLSAKRVPDTHEALNRTGVSLLFDDYPKSTATE